MLRQPRARVPGTFPLSIPVTFLLFDRFDNSDGSGSRTRTCEPGPGTFVITDASPISSISNNRMIWTGTPAAVSGFLSGAAQTRLAGRAMRINYARFVGAGLHRIGWNTALNSSMSGGVGFSSAVQAFNLNGGGAFALPAFPGSLWIIFRTTGYFVASDYKLLWVHDAGTTSNLKPTLWISNGQAPDFDLDDVSVYDLTGVWAVDGPKLSATASPVSGATATSEGNGIVEITWTAAAAEVLQLDFRTQDSNNLWRIKCDQAASRIYLYERVAGVETERGATGGIATTFTATTAYRILVTFDGTNIRVFVDGVLKQNYASASNFQAATGVAVSGFATAANLIVWKRDL